MMVAGGPGSRSKASTVGTSIFVALESEGWSSSAASCASQISVGLLSTRVKSMGPARSASTVAVFTHSGRCLGQRFSKKWKPSTPSG